MRHKKRRLKLVNEDILQLNVLVVLEGQQHNVLLLPKYFTYNVEQKKKKNPSNLLFVVGQVMLIHQAYDDEIQQDVHHVFFYLDLLVLEVLVQLTKTKYIISSCKDSQSCITSSVSIVDILCSIISLF